MAVIYKCDRCGKTHEPVETKVYTRWRVDGEWKAMTDLCQDCANDFMKFATAVNANENSND